MRNAEEPLRVLHSIGSVRHQTGGPARSTQGLCAALQTAGVEAWLLSHLAGDVPWMEGVAPRFTAVQASSYRGSLAALREQVRRHRVDLIHDHSLWAGYNHAAAAVAASSRIPEIIAPRGTLSQWSLNHKRWKKRVAMALYQGRDLRRARAFHVTAEQEADDVRRLGLRQPIVLLPNGVDVPAEVLSRQQSPRPPGTRRRVLYMGRIHLQKGLRELLRAWAAMRPENWQLQLVGPDVAGHQSLLMAEAAELGLRVQAGDVGSEESEVVFRGAMDDARKWAAYLSADLAVLPSFSENFGIVVVEALAAGIPVIATHGTPWQALESRGCGWWVRLDPGILAQTLGAAIALQDGERQAMGNKGRAWVQDDYMWPSIGERMKVFYLWLLHGGQTPAFVLRD